MSIRNAFRSAFAALAFATVCAPPALAAPYVSGALPPEFTNAGETAWIPSDPQMLKNELAIAREAAKLTQRTGKCYAAGARNFAKGKPTKLVDCLASVREKYLAKLAKIVAKAPGLPPCHDYAEEPGLVDVYVKASVADLLCASPDGAYVDGAIIY
jgi:hypothetical protein